MNEIKFVHKEFGNCSVKCNRDEVTDFVADLIFGNMAVLETKIIPSPAEPLKVAPKTVEYAFNLKNGHNYFLRIVIGLLIAIASVWGCQWLFENTGYGLLLLLQELYFLFLGLELL